MSNSINNVCLYESNTIVVDSVGHVYYNGDNMTCIVGPTVSNSKDVIMTNVVLTKGETIKKFYTTSSLVAFHTSERKLYVSRNYNPSSVSNINSNSNNTDEFDIDTIPESETDIINIEHEDPTKICGINILDALKIYRDNYPYVSQYGFDLLEVNVDDVTFSNEVILFVKDSHVNVFTIGNTKYMKLNTIMTKIIGKSFGYYFQLLLPPINIDTYDCGSGFIYMRSKTQQYILSTKTFGSHVLIKLIHWNADADINVNDIVYCRQPKRLIVNIGGKLCDYSYKSHTFESIHSNVKNIYIGSINNVYFTSLLNNAQYLHAYDGSSITKSNQISAKYDVIDYFVLNNHAGIMINLADSQIIDQACDVFVFNIADVKSYGISSKCILFCNETNTLFMITNDQNAYLICCSKFIVSSEGSKIGSDAFTTYYVYSIRNFPEDTINIVKIHSTDNRIIVQTKIRLYNYNSDRNTFDLININEVSASIDKSLISSGRESYRDTININVDVNFGANKSVNLFDKLLIMASSFTLTKNKISVNLIDRINHTALASGEGPTKEFISEALIDFSAKYLIVNPNKTVEYNMTTMQSYTDIELVAIGNMLSYIITYHDILPIRLPLTLLSTIQKRVSVAPAVGTR